MTDTTEAAGTVRAPRAPWRTFFWWLLHTLLIVFLALVIHLLEFNGVFAGAEGRLADLYLRRSSNQAGVPLITIAIDDEDYRRFFNETSPLDPNALITLIETITTASPKVIGVDILTNSDEFAAFDRAAATTVAKKTAGSAKPPQLVPIVWAADARLSEDSASKQLTFREWLRGTYEEPHFVPGKVRGIQAAQLPERTWGVPLFLPEEDRAVRRLPRSWKDEHGTARRTFAGMVASVHCGSGGRCSLETTGRKDVPHGEVFISYGRGVPQRPNHFVRDLFECESASEKGVCKEWAARFDSSRPLNELTGSIVLLGGTFDASRDFFATPRGERLPGLLLNAQAVRAETQGPLVYEFSHLTTLVFDIAVGFFILWIFSEHSHQHIGLVVRRLRPWLAVRADHVLWRVLTTIGLGVALAAISYFVVFRRGHILWLSWIAMLLTGLTWHIVLTETHNMRLKHRKH